MALQNEPLFTVLIPVYKTNFVSDILQSLNAQSYKRFEVIFSDDSPDQSLAEEIENFSALSRLEFKYSLIKGNRIGPVNNCMHLLKDWKNRSKYIHFLFDDDIIFPSFYEEHARALQMHSVDLSISARLMVNEKKQPVIHPPVPDFISCSNAKSIKLHREEIIPSIFPLCTNWLGEMSNATFVGERLVANMAGALDSSPYYGLNDIGLFMETLRNSPIAYINNNLGAFRSNRYQTSRDHHSLIFQSTVFSWASLIIDSYKLNWIDDKTLAASLNNYREIVSSFRSNSNYQEIFHALDESNTFFLENFPRIWNNILSKQPDSRTVSLR